MPRHARPVTDEDRRLVAELHAQGLSRNAIARQIGRSGRTVTKIADELGLDFERARTRVATEARKDDARARRAALAVRLLDDAERMRQQLWEACTVYNFGGKDNTFEQALINEPSFADKHKIMSSVGIAIDRAVRLDEYDADPGIDAAKSMLGALARGLGAAYDQLNHDVALQNLPVTFALDRGGIVGEDGPTHHGVFDFAYMRHIPGLVVSAPKDENELAHLLYSAINYGRGPWSLRYPRGAGLGVACDNEWRTIVPGTAEVLREGTDVLLLAIGRLVYPALAAAEKLAKDGLNAAVINARFVKPLDEELILKWARVCGRVVTAEDGCLAGGFGSAVMELLWARGLDGQVKLARLGYPDEFVAHARPDELLNRYNLTAEGIAAAARKLANKK